MQAKKLRYQPIARIEYPHVEDADLARRYVDGDEHAFTELVRRYERRLQNFVYRTIGDRERAEDLVQETFKRVYHHIGRYDSLQKFSTWIFTIASNLAKNELRDRERNPLVYHHAITRNWDHVDEDHLDFEDERVRPDDMYHKRYLREQVDRAVAQLPLEFRIVFDLRERKGLSYREICEICDCKLGTMKSRLNRARTAFAAIIEPAIG